MIVCKIRCAMVLVLMHGNSAGATESAGQSGNDRIPPEYMPPADGPPPGYEAPPTLQELRIREREARRRSAAIERLHRCQEKEGPVFSQEKYDKYRRLKISGIALTAVGGASLVSAVFFFGAAFVNSFHVSDGYDDEYEGRFSDYGLASLTFLAVSAASLAAGIPLSIYGARGMKRQKVILNQYEILNPASPTLSLRLSADPKSGTWGLGLTGRF